MNYSKFITSVMVLGMALIIGTSGIAFAYPGGYHGWGGPMMQGPQGYGWGGQQLTQEQQTAMQELYSEYNKQYGPLQQQLIAKRSELNSLYYGQGQNVDNSKVQALYKEITDIEAKLLSADVELRKKLEAKGLSGNFGMPYGRGGWGMHGGGWGHGCGWGMHRGGGCW